jgi:hypothetical protein
MSDTTDSQQSALSEDLVWGTQAIADELGLTLSQTQYLIRIGAITVARPGPKTLVAFRKQLRRDLTPKTTKTPK